MQVQRLTPEGAFPDWLKGLEKRVQSLETRKTGSIVVEPDQTLQTTDPTTGVATIFGNLPDGSTGLKLWVGDTTPPPVPSTPIVSSALGTITMLWNGSFAGTATAPADFDHINAYSQNVTGGPVSLAGSMRNANDSVIFSGVAIPGDKWVCWLTALDANGNESAASIYSAPITVASVLDDSGLSAKLADNQSQIDQANANIATANTAIATKSTISSQSTAPTGAHSGDYWLDTSNGNKAMYYNGAAWVAVQDAAIGQALTTANGKNTIVSASTAPTGSHTTGDTWFDTSNGNRPNTWSGTAWVSAQDAAIATAQSAANSAQTSANDKNTITYSSSAASGSGINTGDVWFQTNSSGNIIGQWQWSGSAWVQQVIDNSLIAANIDAGKITAGYIAAGRIQAGTITASMIAADTITAGNIAAGTITTNEIKANTITASNIAANTITASQIAANTITAGQIAANTITTNQIAASTITSTNIAASAITADRIAGGTITATQIAAGTITANNIAANAITGNKISAGAIDGMLITGAVVQTAPSGARVVVDTTGLNAFDSSSNKYFSLSAGSASVTGTISATGAAASATITTTMGPHSAWDPSSGSAGISTPGIAFYTGTPVLNSTNTIASLYSKNGQDLYLTQGGPAGSGGGSNIQLANSTAAVYGWTSATVTGRGGVTIDGETGSVSLKGYDVLTNASSTPYSITRFGCKLSVPASSVQIPWGNSTTSGIILPMAVNSSSLKDYNDGYTVSAGVVTIPATSIYAINVSVGSGGALNGYGLKLYLEVNGTYIGASEQAFPNTSTWINPTYAVHVKLNAGDTVRVRTFLTGASTSTTITNSGETTYISISK